MKTDLSTINTKTPAKISELNFITTKELAERLGTSPKVVLENAKKCLPNKVIANGKATLWNEVEVTVLLEFMKVNNNRTDLDLYDRSKGMSTELTPALKLKKALDLAQEAYEEELAILKSKNIELQAENKQQSHALKYDKVKEWTAWSELKKMLAEQFEEFRHRISFKAVIESAELIEGEDYEKIVRGLDKFPTLMISPSGKDKILDWCDDHICPIAS